MRLLKLNKLNERKEQRNKVNLIRFGLIHLWVVIAITLLARLHSGFFVVALVLNSVGFWYIYQKTEKHLIKKID